MRATPAASRQIFWLLQIGGWAAFVVALLLPWLGAAPVGVMIVRKLPVAVLGLLITLVLRWLYRLGERAGASRAMLVVAVVVACSAGAWVWVQLLDRLAPWVDPWIGSRAGLLRLSFDRMPDTVYYAFILGVWSLLYLGLRRYRALQIARERTLQAEASADRARLEALRYQINPHFLFNTLNAISTLVVEGRTADAERMIARLGDFLRLTLDRAQADVVPLEEELDFVRRYLDIEAIRFDERLVVRFDVEPDVLSAQVPTMILQPIVKNALRYAVGASAGGRVIIGAGRAGDVLRLSVTDDGPGIAGGVENGHGIGLANTRARLTYHYGEAHRLALTRVPSGGVSAVPYATDSDPDRR